MRRAILTISIVVAFSVGAVLFFCRTGPPGRVEFSIKARQYAFEPPRIIVNRGDEVHIRLASLDVVHGFYLEGYDIDCLIEPGKAQFKMRRPSEGKEFSPVDEIVFVADKAGKYRYRCSHTCGTLHPFMQGELIVRPNYAFVASIGGTVGVLAAMFATCFIRAGKRDAGRAHGSQVASGGGTT